MARGGAGRGHEVQGNTILGDVFSNETKGKVSAKAGQVAAEGDEHLSEGRMHVKEESTPQVMAREFPKVHFVKPSSDRGGET